MPYADHDLRRDLDRARRRTAERIARGLCPRCGEHPPVPGRSLCQQCGAKRRLADRARVANRRQAGIKRVRNPEARKAECQRARQRAENRFARGLCANYRRDPHKPDRRLCAAVSSVLDTIGNSATLLRLHVSCCANLISKGNGLRRLGEVNLARSAGCLLVKKSGGTADGQSTCRESDTEMPECFQPVVDRLLPEETHRTGTCPNIFLCRTVAT